MAALAAWVGLPGIARGADVQVLLGSGIEWDSNITRTGDQFNQGWIGQVRPAIHLLEDEGNATWDVWYQPTYENTIDSSLVNNWSQYFTGTGGYHFNDATQFFIRDNFTLSDAINTITALDLSGVGVEDSVSSQNELVYRNELVAGIDHAVTPRLIGTLAFNNQIFHSQLTNRQNNQTYGGTGRVRYLLTPRHTVGVGLAGSYQNFEASEDGLIAASSGLFINLFGTWNWLIDETTTLEITAGPTYIDSNQDNPPAAAAVNPFPIVTDPTTGLPLYSDATSCPVVGADNVLVNTNVGQACPSVNFLDPADAAIIPGLMPISPTFPGGSPGGLSSTSWTIFGEVKITKRWAPNLSSSLWYNRRESTASGLGGSTVLDSVVFFSTWQISELWDTSVRANYDKRSSTQPQQQTYLVVVNTPVPGGSGTPIAMITGLTSATLNNAVDTDRYGVAWRLTRRITKHLTVSTRYTYTRQTSEANSNGITSDFEDHLVTLNVQYEFDRWTLW